MENYFIELNSINVSDKVEKKNGLSYLSWAWAWGELKKKHPDANYTVYENADGIFYFTDGRTAWVKTGVTVDGIEHIEYLPIMDYRNKSIPLENITSFDVNKAIQRSLTKAVARHGLGLYIYAGEDLPEEENKEKKEFEKDAKKEKSAKTRAFNKAQKTGVYEEPKQELTLDERYKNLMDYLNTLTVDTFDNLSPSVKDRIVKLRNEVSGEQSEKLEAKIKELMNLEDEIVY